jgi:hypothetical protein
MPVTIAPVESAADLDTFIRLPARLYDGMANYCAPLTIDRRALLDPAKASFFRHGKAQYWLAKRDGRPVGRISAQIDHAQPKGAFNDAGLFGCLDAIDDLDVTGALLRAAEDWLRSEGRTRAVGPFVLNINGEPGLLVEGHLEPALTLVPWHPPYLGGHMTVLGYAGCKDLHYWRLPDPGTRLAELQARRPRPVRPPDVITRPLDMRHAARDLEIIRQVYNDAWRDNWGFVPLQPEDIGSLEKDLKPFMRKEYGVIVERAGRPLGVALILPNLFEATRDVGTDPSWLGWGKLAYRSVFHHFRTAFVILLGVLPEIRHSVGGAVVAMSLVDEMTRRFANYDSKAGWVEAGWVLDNNVALQKILVPYGFTKARTLRLFDRALPAR